MKSRLGLMLFFQGDKRKVNAAITGVTSFSAVSAALKLGDQDVTSTYINTAPSSAGNILISDLIGGAASILPGSYRYFISGTYNNKKRTWYFDVPVLPQDLSLLAGMEIPIADYNPFVEEVTIYEGDNFTKNLIVPGVEFTLASGTFRLYPAEDKTSTYCSSVPNPVGDTITTHNIGGLASIPAGDYGYFLQGTYNNAEAVSTWWWKVRVLPKQGVL